MCLVIFFPPEKQTDCGKFAQNNVKSQKNMTVVKICEKITDEKKTQFRYYCQISSAMSVLLRKSNM